jgi:hypothetical protein
MILLPPTRRIIGLLRGRSRPSGGSVSKYTSPETTFVDWGMLKVASKYFSPPFVTKKSKLATSPKSFPL